MQQNHPLSRLSILVVFIFFTIFNFPVHGSAEDFAALLTPFNSNSETVQTITPEEAAEIIAENSEPPVSGDEFLMEDRALTRADETEENVFLNSNDPFFSTFGSWGQSYDDLWWLKRVHAPEAWSLSRGNGVPVAVIDTGLDFNHEDTPNRWFNLSEANGVAGFDDDGNGFVDDVSGWDFYNRDNNPLDDHGHGTHVSGILGALADNGLGIAGVAPESKVIPIKVLNSQGSGYVSDVISAIRYAANLGAKVINMSLGVAKAFLSKSLQSAFKSAVNYAISKGAVVVAAAGNDNANVSNSWPAGIAEVIAVGATDPNNKKAWFSNTGSLLDFVAPGVDVLSLRAGGTGFGASSVVDPDYSRASGTSMASPIVAGVVALMRAYNPLWSPSQILSRLKASATDLGKSGFDNTYGYGLVDAFKALTVNLTSSASSLGKNSFTAAYGGVAGIASKSVDFSYETPSQTSSTPSFLSVLNHYSWRPAGEEEKARKKSRKSQLPGRP